VASHNFFSGNPSTSSSSSSSSTPWFQDEEAPPGDNDNNIVETPGFDAAPLPVFNNNSNQNAAAMINKTLTFLWCIGPYCEMAVEEQLEILHEAVRCITKACPTAEVQLHTFSRNKSSLVYQDNPVFVVM
jgi:hypothetical protein